MKQWLLILLVIGALPSMAAQPVKMALEESREDKGATCDTIRYRIWYQTKVLQDTTRNQYKDATKEKMRLDVGDRVVHFYSEEAYLSDSLNQVLKKKGETKFFRKGKFWCHLYSNYPKTGVSTFLDDIDFGTDKGKCVEKMETIDWELMPDSVREVLGYECHLARARFKGRIWMAWFADDVPLSYGPWKLGGLPGLILLAYDDARHYVFEAVGMVAPKMQEPMMYNDKEYEPYSRKELNDLKRRFHADPSGYLSRQPNVTVSSTDEYGNPVKTPSFPYNPIER